MKTLRKIDLTSMKAELQVLQQEEERGVLGGTWTVEDFLAGLQRAGFTGTIYCYGDSGSFSDSVYSSGTYMGDGCWSGNYGSTSGYYGLGDDDLYITPNSMYGDFYNDVAELAQHFDNNMGNPLMSAIQGSVMSSLASILSDEYLIEVIGIGVEAFQQQRIQQALRVIQALNNTIYDGEEGFFINWTYNHSAKSVCAEVSDRNGNHIRNVY